jgi:hypothetical protein
MHNNEQYSYVHSSHSPACKRVTHSTYPHTIHTLAHIHTHTHTHTHTLAHIHTHTHNSPCMRVTSLPRSLATSSGDTLNRFLKTDMPCLALLGAKQAGAGGSTESLSRYEWSYTLQCRRKIDRRGGLI